MNSSPMLYFESHTHIHVHTFCTCYVLTKPIWKFDHLLQRSGTPGLAPNIGMTLCWVFPLTAGALKMPDMKLWNMKMRYKTARVENARKILYGKP